MRPRTLLPLLKWPITLAVLAGLLAAAYLVHREARQRLVKEAAEETLPRRVEPGGIKLGAKLAASYGIQDQAARAATWYERTVVYGRVVANPLATAEVRTAFAGTLRGDPKDWPALGTPVPAGRPLGWLDVRFGPQERLDLQAKLREAETKLEGAKKEIKLHQDRVHSLKAVASQELISRGELDLALIQLTQAETQLTTAQGAIEEWQKAREAIDNPKWQPGSRWKLALTSPIAGEITELTTAPGVSVEAGTLVAKVVDFSRPLVRVDFPPRFLTGGPPQSIELFAEVGAPRLFAGVHSQPDHSKPRPVTAVNPRAVPQVDAASQFAGYWYDLKLPPRPSGLVPAVWRPGLFVKGYVQAQGAQARPAVAVPVTALLYHQGWPLVYVCTAPGRYERREVQVLGRLGEEWLLAEGAGVRRGEQVVFNNAQVLLSEEFRGDADND